MKHSLLKANKIYSVTFKYNQDFTEVLIVKSNPEGLVPQVTIKNVIDKPFSFQLGQIIGFLSL